MQGLILPFNNITPKLGANVFLAPGSVVIGDVKLGDDASVWFNTVIRGDVQSIHIGTRTNIQDNSTVHVTSGTGSTDIGDDVTIGHGCIIHACKIGSLSLIGMGSILLDGCNIPSLSFVAAGSVVTPGKTFPSKMMIVGSPAKAVRELTERELEFLSQSAKDYIVTAGKYRC